ncbi:MAG: DUF4328 domain-containing protein [Actinomycetota bacterium]|nr:DUF4328 domain-containing protein [Actinomycetota bacterium]
MTGAPTLPPEGWYPDPENALRERYWDGDRWSDEYREPQVGHHIENESDPPKPLGVMSKVVIAGLVVAVLVELNNIAADLNYVSLISDQLDGNGPTRLELEEAQDRVGAAGIAVGVSYLAVALFAFIPWFHRAYANLRRLGVQHMRYKPGWAIGAWFIPIFNLFRPKQIANDIWRASATDATVGNQTWHERPAGTVVHWWWGLFLLAGFVVGGAGNVIATANNKPLDTRAQVNEALELERVGYTMDAAGSLISVAAAALAIIVVRKVSAMQTETIEEARADGP